MLVLLASTLTADLSTGSGYTASWSILDMERIVQIIRDSGRWGVLASLGLMMAHSFLPFPAELVAIANGMIYGSLWGFVITWSGAMLGAFLAFGVARGLGRQFVSRRISGSKLEHFDNWLASKGVPALLFVRLLPIVAFNLINYAAGLSKVSWWTFSWTTGLGIVPVTALMVVAGDRIYGMSSATLATLIVFAMLLVLGIHYLLRRIRGKPPDP